MVYIGIFYAEHAIFRAKNSFVAFMQLYLLCKMTNNFALFAVFSKYKQIFTCLVDR